MQNVLTHNMESSRREEEGKETGKREKKKSKTSATHLGVDVVDDHGHDTVVEQLVGGASENGQVTEKRHGHS